MANKLDRADWERLGEIREEMMDLLHEAKDLVRMGNRSEYERAKAYWIGHIDSGLGGGEYIDTYNYTLEKTIKALEPSEDEEDDDEDEEATEPCSD